jgi:hypothetical protein
MHYNRAKATASPSRNNRKYITYCSDRTMPMNPRLLRPTGQFDPRRIAGLELWLDASDQSTMTLNGTTVSEWRSKAGSAALTQATGSAQPTLTANYHAGRSALTFDGNDAISTTTTGLAIAPSSSFLVFDESTAVNFGGLLVGAPASGDDFEAGNSRFITTVHDNVVSGSNTQLAALRQSAGSTASSELRTGFSIGASAYGKRLMTVVVTSSTGSVRVGGVQGTDDAAHDRSGTSSGILVGGRFVGGVISASFRFNGRICEILHYNQALSSAQVSLVERWLAGRWGVTLV